jgi:tRNA C32,U32 (ribose-2'-O)-methylase TrmJ
MFSSLNLAQSVLLISYQLNVFYLEKNKESSQIDVSITKANYEEMQAFAMRLEN